ncbi:hypothetical protein [Amycolatopsis azurea]|nr:hypothetical protein [Amycolatopsis azurea]
MRRNVLVGGLRQEFREPGFDAFRGRMPDLPVRGEGFAQRSHPVVVIGID